jgi:hypothetical protein
MNKLSLVLLTLIGLVVSTLSHSSTISTPGHTLTLSVGENAGYSLEKNMAYDFSNTKEFTLGGTNEWRNVQGHFDISTHYDSHQFGNHKWINAEDFGHNSHGLDDNFTAGSLSVPLPQSWALLMVGCAILFGLRIHREKTIQDKLSLAA